MKRGRTRHHIVPDVYAAAQFSPHGDVDVAVKKAWQQIRAIQIDNPAVSVAANLRAGYIKIPTLKFPCLQVQNTSVDKLHDILPLF